MNRQKEYEFWKKEHEKDRVLELISDKNTVDLSQVSDYLQKSSEETELIITELEYEGLVKIGIGTFYLLTYEGYKRVRLARAKGRK